MHSIPNLFNDNNNEAQLVPHIVGSLQNTFQKAKLWVLPNILMMIHDTGRLTNLYMSNETMDNTFSQFWKTCRVSSVSSVSFLLYLRSQAWYIAHPRKLDVEENIELGEDLVVATRISTAHIDAEQAEARR